MVLDEDLKPLHELTEAGKLEHQRVLSEASAECKRTHPLLQLLSQLLKILKPLFF